MINVELADRWDQLDGRYLEVAINDSWFCTVKYPIESGMYVMQYEDGNELIHRTGFASRMLTDEEREAVMEFAREQFETEAMLDEAYEREVSR